MNADKKTNIKVIIIHINIYRLIMTSIQTTTTPPSGTTIYGNQRTTTPASTTTPATNVGYRLPEMLTLQHALKLAIVEDKPLMMDYWVGSLEKTVLIGVKENGEKLIVRSTDEYTSPVSKIYKISNEYVIMTENSIYLVDVNIPTKRISS